MGIIFALIALVSWGVGDFLIQRSTRKFGDWVSLFYIEIFATVALLPFVFQDAVRLLAQPGEALLLLATSLVLLFAGVLDFEALRVGKISVIEPIYALEVPVAVMLAAVFIQERLDILEYMLIGLLVVGIILVATRNFRHFQRAHLERGVWFAVIATLAMGGVNFLFGVSSRATSPLLINWFSSAFIAVVALLYLISTSRLSEIATDWRKHKSLIVSVSVIDNLAWVAYSFSTVFIPIGIATGISESYIAIAALLGLVLNREKLRTHQYVGLLISVSAVVVLAWITGA
jgi:drug/metabolite transporter (DMT)-like permease